ncbi:hypothetical protein ACFLVI_03375, partial [Chloroflexota bacterium]
MKKGGVNTITTIRIYAATSLAIEEIKRMPVPKNEGEIETFKWKVAEFVAREIGETPAVASKVFIMPEVFAPWDSLRIGGIAKSDVFDSIDDMFERVH